MTTICPLCKSVLEDETIMPMSWVIQLNGKYWLAADKNATTNIDNAQLFDTIEEASNVRNSLNSVWANESIIVPSGEENE